MPTSLSSARLATLFATQMFLSLACGAAFAQGKTGQLVPQVSGNYLEQTGAQPRFVRFNQLPAALTTALRAGPTASAETELLRHR